MMENSSDIKPHTLIALVDKPCVYQGYIKGFRQPTGCLNLQVQSFQLSHVESLQKSLGVYFNGYSFHSNPICFPKDLVACLGEAIIAIQQTAELPIFESIRIETVSEDDHAFKLWIPCLQEECFHQTVAFTLQFFLHHLAAPSSSYKIEISDEIVELINCLKSFAPKGLNSLRILKSAHQHKIPWRHLAQNTFQLGYGCHSRWFDSTLTDKTPQIAASIARNKYSSANFLKKVGIPVPRQEVVQCEAEALERAWELGYPVVIKPNHEDGGRGVSAGLMTEEQVKKAFAAAQQYSQTVLLEQHVIGKDYRLLVFNGTLVWAIERIPAGITGDGVSTINQLIDQTNRRRIPDAGQPQTLKCIEVNVDTHEFLSDQGYTVNSIPENGRFVRLSRISNISSGGTPVAVFDDVHPDNKRLAETTADLLKLDIAGIDLIMPDIRQSYLTTGGVVIEVNAQPHIGAVTAAHMYPLILKMFVLNRGRIPTFVICSDQAEDTTVQKLHSHLSRHYQKIGWASHSTAYINKERVHTASSLYQAAQTLLMNQTVDAMIYSIQNMDEIKDQGLPFDQFNSLVFLGMPFSLNQNHDEQHDIIRTLFSACQGDRLVNDPSFYDLINRDTPLVLPQLLTREEIENKIQNGSLLQEKPSKIPYA